VIHGYDKNLERKLAAARKQQGALMAARYPTGVVIDLGGPCGNVFHILGTCHQVAKELGLGPATIAEFINETRVSKSYDKILDICHNWLDLIYIGHQASNDSPQG